MTNPGEQPEPRPQPEQQDAGPTQQANAGEALLDTLRRERADFLNYKRRVEQDRASDREEAESQIIERILPLLDELERALAQVPEELRSHPWVQGLALNHHKLIQTLSDLGIERIGARGDAFDPQRHEALFYDEEPNATDQRVNEVFRPGYLMRGSLVRPALVSVAGPPTESPPDGSNQPDEPASAGQTSPTESRPGE
jgi:molecular chaperone GrpE